MGSERNHTTSRPPACPSVAMHAHAQAHARAARCAAKPTARHTACCECARHVVSFVPPPCLSRSTTITTTTTATDTDTTTTIATTNTANHYRKPLPQTANCKPQTLNTVPLLQRQRTIAHTCTQSRSHNVHTHPYTPQTTCRSQYPSRASG